MKGAKLAARLLPFHLNSGLYPVASTAHLLGLNASRNIISELLLPVQATTASQLTFVRGMAKRNKTTIEYISMTEPQQDDYKNTDPANFPQLLAAIRQSENLDRVKDLMDKFATRFDTPHYVAAILAVAKRTHLRGTDIVQRENVDWSETTKPFWQRPNARPRQNLVQKSKSLIARIEEQFPPHLNNLYPRQVAHVIYSYGILKRRGIVDGCPFLGDLILAISHDNFRSMDLNGIGADYSQIFKGLANLHAAGSPADADTRRLIEDVAHSLSDEMLLKRGHIRKLDAREVQTILWSYGRIFGKNSFGASERSAENGAKKAVVDLLCDAMLSSGVTTLAPSAYAGAFWALAQLNHASRKDLLAAMARGYSLQTTLLSPLDVNMTLCSCAELNFRDENLFHLCAAKAAELLPEFTNTGLAYMMAAIGELKYNHNGFFTALNKSILDEPVVEIDPDHAWRALKCYRGAGRKDEQSLKVCGRLVEAVLRKVDEASESNCSMILDEVVQLGLVEAGQVTDEQLGPLKNRQTWLQGKQ
mmetsp:Transcript_33738/g.60909  ORF Transcript_33738/g.60909 Transcript_33738/m.60909 type:complete len:532 (-) Transcript_33738:431-2026(-)|eukprot:CAMPEP_0175064342 /NCGR_PEP_ID=MMETSP0052_2-20121109/15275_1 /TAXON_ID=51329 ORGANISM="Polytomella parva, Strain SAG 63-3" /NCGR_SAMPLE_ID=MMETSP0052_2 /ASSEMBLY_ACC=CAM_ASM_000194 /LENGTH=531 /DNA_ID=CAMNT_0016330673 /DNA_START=65 /DNA_END=1660 /DNA_ORIENTATION=-